MTAFLQIDVEMLTSAIICTKYLACPYRTNDTEKINVFFEFLTDCEILIYPISVEVAKKATETRARYQYLKNDRLFIVGYCLCI